MVHVIKTISMIYLGFVDSVISLVKSSSFTQFEHGTYVENPLWSTPQFQRRVVLEDGECVAESDFPMKRYMNFCSFSAE